MALAVRRALREALGEAAARFEVLVVPHGVEVRAADWPGADVAWLIWVAPVPKWLSARIDAFEFNAEPLAGVLCTLTLDPLNRRPRRAAGQKTRAAPPKVRFRTWL